MSKYHTTCSVLSQYLPTCVIIYKILPCLDFYEYERREVQNELKYKFRPAGTHHGWTTLQFYLDNSFPFKNWMKSRLFYSQVFWKENDNNLRECYQYISPVCYRVTKNDK